MITAIFIIVSILIIIFIYLIIILHKQNDTLFKFYDKENIKNKKIHDNINQIKQDLDNRLTVITHNITYNDVFRNKINNHIEHIFCDTSSIRALLIELIDIINKNYNKICVKDENENDNDNDKIWIENEKYINEIIEQNIKQIITEISNYLNNKTIKQ